MFFDHKKNQVNQNYKHDLHFQFHLFPLLQFQLPIKLNFKGNLFFLIFLQMIFFIQNFQSNRLHQAQQFSLHQFQSVYFYRLIKLSIFLISNYLIVPLNQLFLHLKIQIYFEWFCYEIQGSFSANYLK